jgi:hypothetical protein
MLENEKILDFIQILHLKQRDWQYSYKVTDTNLQIPLTMGRK